MVDAGRLLGDLKKLRKKLEDDLRRYHTASAGRAAVDAEWREAGETKRTADTFETFFGAALDQAAVHWILAVVFLRFLEDNHLLDRPYVAGPGERLEVAQLRQRDWFRTRPEDSDAEYLLAVFSEVSNLPGLRGLFDPERNPLFRLPVSGDGAIGLFEFFRQRSPETGELLHDFTDPDWNTRFLGDLYQDLSEEARKRYALLQTPEFVEQWILSRTLDPAIREFGYEQVRMIDPTCGSGHFLLGGFARMLQEWRRNAPEMPPAAQAQRALDAVAGVDLNPFAAEIARFRLLVSALRAAGETRLAAAPDFRFQLATGDSLLHGRHFARRELGGTEEGFRRVLRHHYTAEDTAALDVILGRQYHAVVGNPPYITPKDTAMRDAYREIYESCHGKYGLGAPFTERFFELAQEGARDQAAGFVGLIVANSFMKREFGKKLIEQVLPRLDLTHVVDCSGAYIPGHGTPTVILFGRNRAPVESVVRTVRGVRGEPSAPEDPTSGLVWSSIVAQIDQARSESSFISTEDTVRGAISQHPWNIGGGGAAEAQQAIEANKLPMASLELEIGFASFPGADDVFIAPASALGRLEVPASVVRPIIIGEQVRDHRIVSGDAALAPYDQDGTLLPLASLQDGERLLWQYRTTLGGIISFGGRTKTELGEPWWCWYRWVAERYRTPLAITFAFVATHNHFVFDRGGKVFNRSAPIIKLTRATETEYLGLLGLLNSSTACFWMKQIFHNKGSTVDDRGARQRTDPFEDFYEFTGTGLQKFPLAVERPIDLARDLDLDAHRLSASLPHAICASGTPARDTLDAAHFQAETVRARMITLQEELDWRCYHAYGLLHAPLEHATAPPLRLGERAFEIVMARRMAAGDLDTAWFERHRSTPLTELPTHWPDDYRSVVERRITLIESDPTIALIERPEYKRRWVVSPWDEMEREALLGWLLDRLEAPRFWRQSEPQILSARALADAARHDADFLAVAELFAGRTTFDFDALVEELVTTESVPFLATLRYTESGLRKRADWETTWEKQRAEDLIDAELAERRAAFLRTAWSRANARRDGESGESYAVRMAAGLSEESVQEAADADIAREAKRRKAEEVGDIPVPPKYRTPDFQSQNYWRLRGGLDVPKDRFVSFPHCARDADSSLPILWAGYDHLARARAIAAWYVERKDSDGWSAERLKPLLAGLMELVPWLRQWHNNIDTETGLRMGDFFLGYIEEQTRELGLTLDDLPGWTPPASVRRGRGRRNAA
ncbi:BREX-2 system adenine-specific DNA-methyltransferase PglX [Mesorhizobium sp. P16.1]|uniref:BREX-2 system adenine-specific DNA-methyltransferase PglX n=1 Tax=unclassified Mesorhizobium TaxID=325217 RepID=UPI0021A46288|nr:MULTISPECIES: BREX-2 system adenine-specific DNA-methyltransferase PglX [unclassified Mesorhizobium]MCT2580894.1 BREX-2 system adenine-specific DNA-methyltransferase PglX [Mesorhizobium sp. P13.3]MDF3169967.1 BREX-2 system adenine-specific DNA-methyltransferase PglX [Mesorhizobium sp. P16.1]MDF3181305.1 BREX-2 system adenine-specific DNA-methyltransferase PglX [Mesorhizobium sp. P17.1]MDF3186926.1 BREX-2 system adenine-specific DNA-methyltransferase PglX [Mesorhizobium sp. ICCV3110.1]